ncbi:MAG: UDP-2,3-diacylglucosamine diphosphatase LpxI, partial [Pseudomonadota bacterium]
SMLARAASSRDCEGAILFKTPKRGQELRVDMPAIGPETITQAKTANLAGISVAAGVTMIVARAETLERAAVSGLSVWAADVAQGRRPQAAAQQDEGAAQVSDAEKANALVTLAWSHASPAVGDLGVIVRRGHPYAILSNGLRDRSWPDRLATMTPLKWLGVLPRRAGHLTLVVRAHQPAALRDESADAMAAALVRSGLRSANLIVEMPATDQAQTQAGDHVEPGLERLSAAMQKAGLPFQWSYAARDAGVRPMRETQP